GESRRADRPPVPADVVNLAALGDGAASYVATLEDYAYLGADVICVYDGYGDPRNASSRRESPVFKVIGYMPLLTRGEQGPPLGARGLWPGFDDRAGDASELSCDRESAAYCETMIATVNWAVSHGASVVVVTPPYVS